MVKYLSNIYRCCISRVCIVCSCTECAAAAFCWETLWSISQGKCSMSLGREGGITRPSFTRHPQTMPHNQCLHFWHQQSQWYKKRRNQVELFSLIFVKLGLFWDIGGVDSKDLSNRPLVHILVVKYSIVSKQNWIIESCGHRCTYFDVKIIAQSWQRCTVSPRTQHPPSHRQQIIFADSLKCAPLYTEICLLRHTTRAQLLPRNCSLGCKPDIEGSNHRA